MTMAFIGGGAAVIGAIGSWKSAATAKDAMKEEKKKENMCSNGKGV